MYRVREGDLEFLLVHPGGPFWKHRDAGAWTIPKGEDGKEQPGDLNWLHCIALDSKGNIYAGDIVGKRIQKFVRKAGS